MLEELIEPTMRHVRGESRAMTKHTSTDPHAWLEQAFPQMHYLLLALDGEAAASRWLAGNSSGVSLLARAIDGEEPAMESLAAGQPGDHDDLFELIENEDIVSHLALRRPDIHRMFAAVKGDADALERLNRKHGSLARLIPTLQAFHTRMVQAQNGEVIGGGTVADMGCLIGEMHLRQGEYEKAVEAFTRALETQPAADLYEGRARAYRGIAEQDERDARKMRARG